jgi:hypothetical protein
MYRVQMLIPDENYKEIICETAMARLFRIGKLTTESH